MKRIILSSSGHAMTKTRFKCRQCGQCCLSLNDAFTTCATESDVQRWMTAGREDILAWVDPIAVGDECVYDIWVNPTKDRRGRSPLPVATQGSRHGTLRLSYPRGEARPLSVLPEVQETRHRDGLPGVSGTAAVVRARCILANMQSSWISGPSGARHAEFLGPFSRKWLNRSRARRFSSR